jgi:hypothetical protein
MPATKTSPSRQDVQQLVAALFAVTSGLERARRQIPDAAALSVLQEALTCSFWCPWQDSNLRPAV